METPSAKFEFKLRQSIGGKPANAHNQKDKQELLQHVTHIQEMI